MPIGEDALGNYAYQIEIDGITLASFKEVSGLSAEIQPIERGKTDEPGWWKWIKEVQDGKIDGARRNASVVLYDYERGEKARFNLFNAWPSKVSVGSLQAGGNEIAIEECTIVHEGLELA